MLIGAKNVSNKSFRKEIKHILYPVTVYVSLQVFEINKRDITGVNKCFGFIFQLKIALQKEQKKVFSQSRLR
jgi:hypothetical protein